ncbi:hypothetical protein GGR50DRAFT_707112 [Xylaria sp. CBS 124048]|nr:hypothetical protein GGR50DRAFT_707112 [Xylaria sp. CBS 124048]
MARPLFDDIFFRLPHATAVLFLNAVFCLTNAHAFPRQTKVVEFRELDVVSFPLPAPTHATGPHPRLQLRQENTICGFLGGDPGFPATCSLGSHCVLDVGNSVVGCCPDGGACTTGVFTGCVDRNSDPQTEINPYVYSCGGSDVCFRNEFAGGFYQYGCGTASELGTTVETSALGASAALSIQTTEMSLTESAAHLETPTTIGSFASSETNGQSGLSSQSTKETLPSMITSPASTTTSLSSATTWPSSVLSTLGVAPTVTKSTKPTGVEIPASARQSQNGAMIGGIVGGAAAAVSIVALAFFCLRRRNRNHRTGPGPSPSTSRSTEYTSPMQQRQSRGGAFAPLPSWHDEEISSATYHSHPHPQPPESYGPLEPSRSRASSFHGHPNLRAPDPYAMLEPNIAAPPNLGPSGHTFPQPLRYNPAYVPAAPPPQAKGQGSLTPVVEEDQSTEREDEGRQQQRSSSSSQEREEREIDDFSRAYSSAGIGQMSDSGFEDDRRPLRYSNTQGLDEYDDEEALAGRARGHRPLWQQNRQQSRNLMWL